MAALEEAVGYVIMENDNTYKEVSDLQPINDNGLTYVRFNTILQSLDCTNRNKRYYKADAMVKSLSTPIIQELIRNNKFKGEAGHPVGQPIPRISVVMPGCTCHRVIKWWIDGNLIRGTVETLDDGQGCPGTKLTRAILQNENPSFSYRGLANITKKGNISYILAPPITVAYDEVNTPSHPEAYGDAEKTIVNQAYTGQSSQATVATKFVNPAMESVLFSDQSIAVYGRDIAEMFKRGSDNVKSVCEAFDIDPSNISMYGKSGNVELRNGSDRIVVSTERKLARQIANMWRGM